MHPIHTKQNKKLLTSYHSPMGVALNRFCGSVCLVFACMFLSAVQSIQGDDVFDKQIRPLLDSHCIRCHKGKEPDGDTRLDLLQSDFGNRDQATVWLEVRNQINLGQMPPEDEDELTVEQIRLISQWIATQLKEAERQQIGAGGKVLMRRMNRFEYANTIADLLEMKYPSGESPLDFLPPDGTRLGFDKVSSALTLDPSLLTMYYNVARRIADRAIVDGPPKYPTQKMRLEYEEMAESHAIGYLFNRLGIKQVPGGIQLAEGNTRSFGMLRYPGRKDNNVAPVNGFYRFTVRAGGKKGANGEVPRLRLTHSHPDDKMRKIFELDVKADWDEPKTYSFVVARDTLGGELQLQLVNQKSFYMSQRPGEHFIQRINKVGQAGNYKESIRLAGRKMAEGWGGDRSTPDPDRLDETRYPRVFLDYLEVEGPLYDQWPPKSHTSLLFREKKELNNNQNGVSPENLDYAEQIFHRFLPRAWRRPVSDSEVKTILTVVEQELENGGTFHDSIRIGLTAALTSPKFLFLVEPAQQKRNLTEYELASRLSYFLWSSMPDDKLMVLARRGKLSDPVALREQVDRMIEDERSSRFVENFGSQWLKINTFNAFAPDKYLYRSYDEKLSESIEKEPLHFFDEILKQDLSVTQFIDSDFLVINQRLAQHYGIDGVTGDGFRKVFLPAGSRRGGLLGMAGVHQAGSDGVRTKPVTRAAYVLDVLFNDPPDPPPPNAGEIEPNVRGEKLTVRQRLLQHQEIKSCAACHSALDPYGLALENFNVIGSWRDKQDGEEFRGDRRPPITIDGKLPNGDVFESYDEFKQVLLKQSDRLRRGLAEKLLVYALGRPVDPLDDSALQAAVKSMKKSDDSLRSLIKSIVTSPSFLQK